MYTTFCYFKGTLKGKIKDILYALRKIDKRIFEKLHERMEKNVFRKVCITI